MTTRRMFLGALAGASLPSVVLAADDPSWTAPFPPHKVFANLYYVGSNGLAAFLVTTTAGNILINSNLSSSVPAIQQSISQLGFRFSDTKILLISHAHYDHCAGSAQIKKQTGAKYMVMEQDAPEIEAGGKGNFQYGDQADMLYPPAKVDRRLHDGESVELGGSRLTAHLTPGHTRGCTTWSLSLRSGDREYSAVIVGSPNVNSGYRLVNNRKYPTIAQDYRLCFQTLSKLPCDIFLGAHGAYYGLEAKYPKLAANPNVFIDPQGYKDYVAERKQAFERELAKQSRS